MESWKLVLRNGFLWQWSTERLEAALVLLVADSPKLAQGSTTSPPPLLSTQDWPLEACDLVAFCSIDDPFEATVGEAEEGFAKACFDADQKLGEPAACRWLLNAYDDTPRGEMWGQLIAELKAEVERRQPIELEPALKSALRDMPEDSVLKRACFDAVLEAGGSITDAQRESGWSGQ